jgi:hypothetical protein
MDVWSFLYATNRNKRKKKKEKTDTVITGNNLNRKSILRKKSFEKPEKSTEIVQEAVTVPVAQKQDASAEISNRSDGQAATDALIPTPFTREVKNLLTGELKDSYQGFLFSDYQGNLIFSDVFNSENLLYLTDICMQVEKLLSENDFSTPVNRYLMLNLQGNVTLFIVKLSSHQLAFMIDASFTNTGYIINILLPKIYEFEKELLIK